MSDRERILWGCIGAFAAILTSLISLDLPTVREQWAYVDGIAVGYYGMKYVIVLVLGGFVAFLKASERDRINLIALGASAPTILVTLFNSQNHL